MHTHGSNGRRKEAGFALILAILALMLLTFLGLALATSTSTELQIATNYRWSQQALYNAHAGIDAAKVILRDLEWADVLAGPRGNWTINCPQVAAQGSGTNYTGDPCTLVGTAPTPTAPAFPGARPTTLRDLENGGAGGCDATGGQMGFGYVLGDGTATGSTVAGYYQNVSTLLGQPIPGNVTLWVRRKTVYVGPGGTAGDDIYRDANDTDTPPGDDTIVVTSEGTAPYRGAVGGGLATANGATRTVEYELSRAPANTACNNRTGQAGGGSQGSGFGGCMAVTEGGVGAAVGGAVTDTGVQ